MQRRTVPVMASDDPRQYMLKDNFEIYEKEGIPSGAMEMHFHGFFELMYIVEGNFTILLDNVTYQLQAGDFILIDCNRLHHYQYVSPADKRCKRVLLWIARPYLEALAGSGGFAGNDPAEKPLDLTACFTRAETPAWHFPALANEQLVRYYTRLLYLEHDPALLSREKQLLQRSYLTLFFVYLNKLVRDKQYSLPLAENSSNEMITRVSAYLADHISEPVSLETLAGVVHLSKYHFIRTFKELTGMTVHDYINHKRIIRSCELINDDRPLKTVYYQCGYASYSAFYRNFKAINGLSPVEYKQYIGL